MQRNIEMEIYRNPVCIFYFNYSNKVVSVKQGINYSIHQKIPTKIMPKASIMEDLQMFSRRTSGKYCKLKFSEIMHLGIMNPRKKIPFYLG